MIVNRQVRARYDNAHFVRGAVDRLRRLGVDDRRIEVSDDNALGALFALGRRHPLLTVAVDFEQTPGRAESLRHALSPGSVLVEAVRLVLVEDGRVGGEHEGADAA